MVSVKKKKTLVKMKSLVGIANELGKGKVQKEGDICIPMVDSC